MTDQSQTDPGKGRRQGKGTSPGSIVLSGRTINCWWPTHEAEISGTHTFKVQVTDLSDDRKPIPTNAHALYWSVGDDSRLNHMSPSEDDSPHYEGDVDVTWWNWSESGEYLLLFTAIPAGNTPVLRSQVKIRVK